MERRVKAQKERKKRKKRENLSGNVSR